MAQDTSSDVSWALLLVAHPVYRRRLILQSSSVFVVSSLSRRSKVI